MGSTLQITNSGLEEKSVGLASASGQVSVTYSLVMDADSVDAFYAVEIEISSGDSEEIDLLDVTDMYGIDMSFASVTKIIVQNIGQLEEDGTYTVEDGEYIRAGGSVSSPFTSMFNGVADAVLDVPSGGIFLFGGPVEGWSVGVGNSKLLFTNVGDNLNRLRVFIEGIKS